MGATNNECKRRKLALACLALIISVDGCTTSMKGDSVQRKADEVTQTDAFLSHAPTPTIVHQKVVETEKIVLKDAAGNVRFEVAITDDGSLINTMRDAKGSERIKLTVGADGVARHTMMDETGTARLGSYVYPGDHPKRAGTAGTAFLNKDGKSVMQLETYKNGEVSHAFFGDNGKERISLNILNDGMAVQHFRDATGTLRTSIYADPTGETAFSLYDSQQRLRFHNIMLSNGKFTQGFINKAGQYKESTTLEENDTINHNAEKGVVRKFMDGVGKGIKSIFSSGSDK